MHSRIEKAEPLKRRIQKQSNRLKTIANDETEANKKEMQINILQFWIYFFEIPREVLAM